jgi:hypothetical protein
VTGGGAAGGRVESPPYVPTYLSHSYRADDLELNEAFWTYFWEQGFDFTVDPKSDPSRTSSS